jgi:tellurite methyltransferase
MSDAITFFDRQFQQQIGQSDFALNPFERKALGHIKGRMLDFGCGLGNLGMEAARSGHEVVAVDASEAAVASLAARASAENLPLQAMVAKAESYAWGERFDTVTSIGLLMFLPAVTARQTLGRLKEAVRENGMLIVNVLIKGTTYLDMFGRDEYCLFDEHEIQEWFSDWHVVDFSIDEFNAPGNTLKRFATIIAKKIP